MTRILLVPIFLLPILWVWPQRGTTAAFYTNPQWDNEPAIVRVERQFNLFLLQNPAKALWTAIHAPSSNICTMYYTREWS